MHRFRHAEVDMRRLLLGLLPLCVLAGCRRYIADHVIEIAYLSLCT